MDNIISIFKSYDLSKNRFYNSVEYVDNYSVILKKQKSNESSSYEVKELVEIYELTNKAIYKVSVQKNGNILISKK